jgi:hypothetical protein
MVSRNEVDLLKLTAMSLVLFKKIKIAFVFVLLSTYFSFSSFIVSAQQAGSLPRTTPEAEGISSRAVIDFLKAAEESRNEFHSFMMLRHGKVVAECWWAPYSADLKHTMYSVSKSFTATAIGFAVTEKKISVHDKVISFFPDQLPDTVSEYLKQLTIKDLLTMTVGHQTDPTGQVASRQVDWVRGFLSMPIVHQPGSKFLYNSLATYVLSAIIQKVTGERVIDYLQSRLFIPLGIKHIDWETDPKGINTGGWGLRLKTEDMARFGQLFLQKGKWNGKQLLPASWVEEATSKKIDQDPQASQARKDSSDWLQGYCYQMWRSRHNSYRGDGAYGQYILVLPDQDAVIIITSETSNMQSELNLVWKYLVPAFTEKLPEDRKSLAELKTLLSSRKLDMPAGEKNKTLPSVSGKTFNIHSASSPLTRFKVEFSNSGCMVTFTDSITHRISFGQNKWIAGETARYGPYLVGSFKGNRKGLPGFKVRSSYNWKDSSTLQLTVRYIESPHTEFITCKFEKGEVLLEFTNSFNQSGKGVWHRGNLSEATAIRRMQPVEK